MARNRRQAVAEANEAIDEMLDVEEEDAEETEEARKSITPADIADATGADPKAIRGWLRANHARPKEQKGKSWDIQPKVAELALAHFTPSDDEDDEVTELEDLESDS